MSTTGEIVTHEEVKKLRDIREKGFGRVVKGFRTMGAAADFNSKWRKVEPAMIRLMYPKRTQGMNDEYVVVVKEQIFNATRKQGFQGLEDFFGGSLHALEHILEKGAFAGAGALATGRFNRSGSFATLTVDILLDIYIFGTGPAGVPTFRDFVVHRQRKVFGDIIPEEKTQWDQFKTLLDH